MNRWEAPESIFAPIIAAVPPDTEWAGFFNTLEWATGGIPRSVLVYNVKRPGTFRKVKEIREREMATSSGESAKPFTSRAWLADVNREGDGPRDAASNLWMLGMTHLKDGLCAPAVPDDYDSAILQVIRFRLNKDGLSGAPQLALVRHRWAEGVLAASPRAIVFGGQRHWDDSWWTESLPQPTVA
jgi:hypothetical protein